MSGPEKEVCFFGETQQRFSHLSVSSLQYLLAKKCLAKKQGAKNAEACCFVTMFPQNWDCIDSRKREVQHGRDLGTSLRVGPSGL